MAADNKEDYMFEVLSFYCSSMQILPVFFLLLTITAIRVNKLDLIENKENNEVQRANCIDMV